MCVCLCVDSSVTWSSLSAGSLRLLLLLLLLLLGETSWASWSSSEGWPLHGSLLNPGERTASHVQTAEGWLMAKWPSRWTSTAPTPRRPSHTTTSTRAASNLHMSTCKCMQPQTHTHTHTVKNMNSYEMSEVPLLWNLHRSRYICFLTPLFNFLML